MSKRKIKHKLLTIFILGISILLLSITITFTYASFDSTKKLGSFAVKIDKDNNKRIASNLFLEITKTKAKEAFTNFFAMKTAVHTLAYNLMDTFRYQDPFKEDIKLIKLKDKNLLINTSPKTGDLIYWGDPKSISEKTKREMNKTVNLVPIFKRTKAIATKTIKSVWLINKDKFIFVYPQDLPFIKNLPSKKVFNKYFDYSDFPQKNNLSTKFSPVYITKPYKDLTGKIVLSIKTAIYDKNKNISAVVGIDIDFELLKNNMLHNNIFRKNEDETDEKFMEGFIFLLGKNGNIVSFPQKYADLFSIPESYLNLTEYNQKNRIKLSDSGNYNIKKLAKNIKENNSGTYSISLNKKDYIIAFSQIKELGWTLGYVIEENSLLSSPIRTKEEIKTTELTILKNHIAIVIFFLLLSFLFITLFFRYFFLKPINKIRKGIKKMGDGNFDINLKEEGAAEIADLSTAFNYLGKELKDYMKNLKKEAEARQAYETEIQIAEKIQRSILPNSASFPTNNKFQLSAKLNAAKNVSGDFYDFFYLSETKIALLIADVSGKGLPAAFFMAMSKVLIKNECLQESDDPAKVLEKVNRALCMDNKAQMFVTVSLIFYNINDGTATYANAGHHSALIVKNNNITIPHKTNNMALGILEEAVFHTNEINLNIGDFGLLYTDGVTEAVSPKGEEYGVDRVKKLIIENINMTLEELCDTIIKDVTNFEDKSRFDDITLVAIKRTK